MVDVAHTRALFDLPAGVTYLNGNSLGPLPKAAAARAKTVLQNEWGTELIRGWNTAGWMALPDKVGDRIARLIGAPEGSVSVGDTLSLKVTQALSAAVKMTPNRRVILSDNGNFPTDLYMAQGLAETLGQGHKIETPNPEQVLDRISEDVAVLMLTEVDYRTGRRHNLPKLAEKARAHGVPIVWDLAHSAGAFPVDLAGADFAVGCTYKFLNGGPGAPAFIYVRPGLADTITPLFSGWLGHAAPFAFETSYRPDAGTGRMRIGTPPVLALSVLDTALDIWDGVDLSALEARSHELSERFIARVEAAQSSLSLASPRKAKKRGAQVSFRFKHGYPAMQALIAQGVIGDFRAPDIMRFGITPLYQTEDDIDRAADTLAEIVRTRAWDKPEFHARKAVT